ncbi:hypothetical protein G4B88_028919 [Cannabis sativa]|uniref:CCHC-type domain-containing protein n=1 Tax=Cannabis sativa TaxID=3483 RepID=A0A7J6HNK9_CANSA|nr:hypothetical protein G4B88_028919 [Cannabis sativa]
MADKGKCIMGEVSRSEVEAPRENKGKEVMEDPHPAGALDSMGAMLASGFKKMSISLEANAELGQDVVERSVVVKMVSRRRIFLGLLRSVLASKWRLARGWKLEEVEPNIFIMRFSKRHEAEMAVLNAPWCICDGFMVVKAMPADESMTIPPRFWTRKNALAVAGRIGKNAIIERMWKNGFPAHEYIRMRVNVQLKVPLLVGLFLPMEEGVSLWCYFKYENLPIVCYKCGIIGHDQKMCRRERRMITNDFDVTVPMYGAWMRLGSRVMDCFSDYAPYERERMEREVADAQNQEEVRRNALNQQGFEPALLGIEIHREALLEANGESSGGVEPPMITAEEVAPDRGAISSNAKNSTVPVKDDGSGLTTLHGNDSTGGTMGADVGDGSNAQVEPAVAQKTKEPELNM